MNVTEVIILLTFVISSDDMYRKIILRTLICSVTFMADITLVGLILGLTEIV